MTIGALFRNISQASPLFHSIRDSEGITTDFDNVGDVSLDGGRCDNDNQESA